MIESRLGGQYPLETVDIALATWKEEGMGGTSPRVRGMVDAHFSKIWRLLRRLGVSVAAADDAAQQVFLVATRRLEEISPDRERQYLQGIAVKVASEHRRAESRRLEREGVPMLEAPLQPDELLDQKRAREQLDAILDAMPYDLRVAFVLFELDAMTIPEIAKLLEVPEGTASSRLRRAREEFRRRVSELQ